MGDTTSASLVDGLPSCGLDVDNLRDTFTKTHVKLSSVGPNKVVSIRAQVDGAAPMSADRKNVEVTGSMVRGWFDLKMPYQHPDGHLWQVAAVHDPEGSLREQVDVGFAVKDNDGKLVCADVLRGRAYVEPLKKK